MEEIGADQADYMLPDQEDVRCYVGVGASAGGVEALQELFQHMPLDTGASFIIVQHLSPDAVSLMDNLWPRLATCMPWPLSCPEAALTGPLESVLSKKTEGL
ncbi:chemotaxis protein CheB [Lachnotalea sp. AF33-28]|jgi:chemotaxis response regulator CheB|uniref:chemotaxis protein CheB n=1 Tax=Lachnotalea sp. AF33-28 TaxID=2292046 RepID=UPI001FA96485|nr:chemotaxis protein CheB [Lachnotalea sp. AF33-28]